MDPFSLALGVLAVVQTAGEAVNTLYVFTQTIQKAPEEIENLKKEASSLHGLLERIDEALRDPKIAAYVAKTPAVEKDLASLKEPLNQVQKRTAELSISLQKLTEQDASGKRTVKKYRWPFVKGDVIDTRNELAHAQDVATFAFTGLNFLENLRKNAAQDSLDVERNKATPSPLHVQLEERDQQVKRLWQAAKDGDTTAIGLLLDAGIPVDSKDVEGRTALSFAAEYGNIEAVKVLIERKAFVNAASNVIETGHWSKQAESKRRPLHWAAAGGHILVAQALLDAGADIEAFTKSQRTPVVEAAGHGHLKTIVFLLDRGANVNARTFYGWTMLHAAASTSRVDIAELLISRGADVEAVYTGSWHGEGKDVTATRQRPLHYAVRPSRRPNQNDIAMVDMVVRVGKAKVSAQDSDGATPLHYAVRASWKAGLKELLRHANIADLAAKDSSGRTALDDAVQRDKEMAEMIRSCQLSSHLTHRQPSPMRLEETFP